MKPKQHFSRNSKSLTRAWRIGPWKNVFVRKQRDIFWYLCFGWLLVNWFIFSTNYLVIQQEFRSDALAFQSHSFFLFRIGHVVNLNVRIQDRLLLLYLKFCLRSCRQKKCKINKSSYTAVKKIEFHLQKIQLEFRQLGKKECFDRIAAARGETRVTHKKNKYFNYSLRNAWQIS